VQQCLHGPVFGYCPLMNAHDPVRPDASTVAADVRAFYERLPYPPPLASLDEHRELYRHPDRRRAQYHLIWPTDPFRGDQDILVAGCGTSQAARYALREPDARITAIDVSDTSLRHTRELQQKYRLENLELVQLSIEDVGSLGRTFDQVVCTGVLHHLPDPDVGLRALREVLRPPGAMHLMVYAQYGRTGIYMMQEYCRLLGITTSDADLRSLGKTLHALPASHPIAGVMRGALDVDHPDALADALLHPSDRAYTVPQLREWLERCGMSFGRWVEQAPYVAECGMVAKTPHAAQLASLPAPQQHAAVELLRGTMFRHNLIAYRNDRSAPIQPIEFHGDRWRTFVPISMPWSVCVRERVPPGSVAVLINRAHAFTDLVLTVDAFEDRLLGAIDGRRTLAEILTVGAGGREEGRALRFFERLWQYDQIVFDASRSARDPE
jgi:SAM-dependent methyltransferase